MLLRQRQLKKSIDEREFALEMARGRLTFAAEAVAEATSAIASIEDSLAADRQTLDTLSRRSKRKHASALRG